jgi:O-antigen/teichoic acid export membrane protein
MIELKAARSSISVNSLRAALSASAISRQTLLLVVNSLVNGFGGIFFWFVAARFYSPAIVGVATAGTSMIVLLATVSQLGLGMGVIRYSTALGPHRRRRLGGIWLITLVGAIVAGLLFWKFAFIIAPGLLPIFSTPLNVSLFVGSCVAWAISILFDSYLVSQRHIGLMVIDNSLTAVCRIAFIVFVSQPSAAMLIAFTGASGLIGVVAVIPALIRQRATTMSPPSIPVTLQTLISYSLWNYWIAITNIVATLTLPSIIISVTNGEQTAAYYMAWSLFSGLTMLPSALSQVLLVTRANAPGTSETAFQPNRKRDLLMLMLALVFIPVALGILALLGRTYFAHGWLVAIILAAGYWPNYRALLLQTEMRLAGSQYILALIYTISYATTLGLSIPLLRLIGTPGAALAWALGQCLLYFLLRRGLHRNRTA